MPTRELDVHSIVERVGNVPSEDNVAKAETAFEGAAKLVDTDVFASQQAIKNRAGERLWSRAASMGS